MTDFNIRVIVDPKPASDGLDKVNAKLKNTESTAERMSSTIKKAFAAYVSFASVRFAERIISQQMEMIDANAKLADSFGISYEALVNMKTVAGGAGVGIEALTSNLTIMQRNLVEAAKGSDAQKRAFESIGISAKELINLSPDKQFDRIATALSRIQNPTQQMTTAMEIFGRGARGMVNVFDEYGRKIEDAAAFNDKFGISLNRVDVAKVEQAKDAMGRVGQAIGGIVGKVGIELAPIIEDMALWFIDSADGADIWAQRTRDAIDSVAWFIDKLTVAIKGVRTAFEQSTTIVGGGFAMMYALATGQKDLLKGIQEAANEEILKKQEDLMSTPGMDSEGKMQEFIRKSREQSEASAKKFAEKMEARTGTGGGAIALTTVTEAYERQKELLKGLVPNMKEYETAQEDLNFLLSSGAITADQYADAMDRLNMKFLEADKTISGGFMRGLLRMKDEFSDIGSLVDKSITNAFHGAEDALVSFVTTGKLSFKDLANSIVSDLARIAVRQSITGPLSDMLGSMGGSIFSSLGGIFGGGRAGGGDVYQGMSYVVGENGPELFNPPGRGSIGQIGSSATTVNVYNSTNSKVEVAESVDGSGNRNIAIMIDEMVSTNIRNSGTMSNQALRDTFGLNPSMIGR